ncbi:hypothetical protein Poli38472_013421 [Pythium oligandrum]|uniref:Uncharacterized protein n=1 Tax=Pythium oligandrum TaxID=41045 RepID=A0A8K1FFS6_PYTOL|nr:hypothetical protein Poli38472_013421 [Pythium oligandrum]|eukprot:TMW57947.1 hypothetical protein Poli38472_013421 [Pythium oligandrum]
MFRDGDDSRISTRQLIADAVRLDHFHAYQAPSTPSVSSVGTSSVERQLSLPLHEDHGLFIAMMAPRFFTVNDEGRLQARRLEADASGFVIHSRKGERVVRPILKEDQVVIMLGTGASRWLQATPRLPAVMHNMRMPVQEGNERLLRAWFGKMTLLPPYQRLLSSKKSFAEFTNLTTRHLLASNNNEMDEELLPTIGCASHRRLLPSEGSCTYNICTVKPEWAHNPPTVGCSHACNYKDAFWVESDA